MKKNIWERPYLGVQSFKDNIVSIAGSKGNSIYTIRCNNIATILSSDKEAYLAFHNTLNNIVSTVGEEMIIQKTDVFTKKVYTNSEEELAKQAYLQRAYSEHFEGREGKQIITLISITRDVVKAMPYNKQEEEKLFDCVEKVYRILDDAGFQPEYLDEEMYNYYYSSIITQNFTGIKSYQNMSFDDNYVKMGEIIGKSLVLIDTEKVELPNEIESYTRLEGNEAVKDTVADNFSFINDLSNYETVIYNQVIKIPNQTKVRKKLEAKKNKHQGLKVESYNELCAQEINEFVGSLEAKSQIIVYAHYNLFVTAKNEEDLKAVESQISGNMFKKGIIISKSSYNQYELFRSLFLGNATELKDYDYFMTTNDVALAFFFKESFLVDDKSTFYLRFTDRQGIPIKRDPADLPMQKGEITNRNKMIIGPSGSGKSFFMNNYLEQCLQYNMDIVIIDVGDSYSSLCSYFKGRYITYREDKPISMNPFAVTESELNEEKKQTLVELLFIIWKGVESVPTKTQTTVLGRLINTYYDLYFQNQYSEENLKTKSVEELLVMLAKFNITTEEILKEIHNQAKQSNTSKANNHYTVLGISQTASKNDIQKAYKTQMIKYHPDKNPDDVEASDKLYLVQEAYTVLKDDVKRVEYDKSLMVILSTEVKKQESIFETDLIISQDIAEEVKALVIAKLQLINRELKIQNLSFNSLYEFAQKFLTAHLKKENISSIEFDLSTFLYNLTPFYKGGIYQTVLNQDIDTSLFEEKFIVFEIDNIKDNPQLFPIVTSIIMDTFIQKMRHREGRRKALFIEEAWKAIASPAMAGMIKYLYKTVRKFWGEVGIITQDLGDIAKSEVVKDAILGSSDILILLDQTKLKKKYAEVAELLNLDEKDQGQIFTINNLPNKEGRGKFKEFWMRIGTKSAVYGNEVSFAQYLTYTTEKPEKSAVAFYLKANPENYDEAIQNFIDDIKEMEVSTSQFFTLVNLNREKLSANTKNNYKQFVANCQSEGKDPFYFLSRNIQEDKLDHWLLQHI